MRINISCKTGESSVASAAAAHIAAVVARARGEPLASLARSSTAAARTLFGLAADAAA